MCVILGVDFLDSSHLEVCKGAWHLFVKCPGRFLLALQEPTCQSPTAVCASRSCGAGHDSGRVGPVAAEVPCSGSHDSDSGPWSQTGHSTGQQSQCPVCLLSRQDTDRDARQGQACDSPARDPAVCVPRRKGSGSRQASVTEHTVPAPLAHSSRSGHRPYS